ncbi:XisI protein [Candidatus Poribacteria bacterium]|nr:XisI protein [Candidatus Poribacteria bacterium]
MDQLNHYRNLAKQFLADYANLMNSQPIPDLETVLCFDDERDQYMLLKIGWPHGRRIRQIILHVAIRNGRIWIEEDMTEEGMATYFLEQGVPNDDIVLGFHSPKMRPFTEFAVG